MQNDDFYDYNKKYEEIEKQIEENNINKRKISNETENNPNKKIAIKKSYLQKTEENDLRINSKELKYEEINNLLIKNIMIYIKNINVKYIKTMKTVDDPKGKIDNLCVDFKNLYIIFFKEKIKISLKKVNKQQLREIYKVIKEKLTDQKTVTDQGDLNEENQTTLIKLNKYFLHLIKFRPTENEIIKIEEIFKNKIFNNICTLSSDVLITIKMGDKQMNCNRIYIIINILSKLVYINCKPYKDKICKIEYIKNIYRKLQKKIKTIDPNKMQYIPK